MSGDYKPKIKTRIAYVGERFKIQLESDVENGELLDTRVVYSDDNSTLTLFWISGINVENFKQDLNELIKKYRI